MLDRDDKLPAHEDQLRRETTLRIVGLSDRGAVSIGAVEKMLRDYDTARDEARNG